MRYEANTRELILRGHDSADNESILLLTSPTTSIEEACRLHVGHINENERIDEDEYDAYWDVELATEVYYDQFMEDMADQPWILYGLLGEQCVDVEDVDSTQYENLPEYEDYLGGREPSEAGSLLAAKVAGELYVFVRGLDSEDDFFIELENVAA